MGSPDRKKQIVGYKYYLDMHLIFALSGVTNVRKIRLGDKIDAWTGNATTNSTISINQPELYGGDEIGGRGGFVASIDLMFGKATQAANAYLAQISSGFNPAYRGRFGMFFRSCYVGNTGSVDNISALLTGADDSLFNASAEADSWNYTKRWIQASDTSYPDINPIHIIRDLLLSSDLGMNTPSADIDDDSFTEAANTLYTEGFGVSMLFTSERSVEDHITEVCRHINAILYQDHADGLYKIKLLRDDYDTAYLMSFDETNSKRITFSRIGIGEMINRVVLTYHDVDNNKNEIVTVDDLALNDLHGGSPISKSLQYTGISSRILAAKVAGRDLKQLSAPLAKVTLEVNRTASTLRPGDVILWSNAELGIVDMPLRIIKMSYGTPKNRTIKIDCTEDVYSYGTTIYTGSNADGWVDPSGDPQELDNSRIIETPWFFYYDSLGGLPDSATSTMGTILTLAGKQTATDFNYAILRRISPAAYVREPLAGEFAIVGNLVYDIDYTEQTIYVDGNDLDFIELGTACIVDNEIMRVDSVNSTTGEITVGRGCADTICARHSHSAPVYFFGGGLYGEAADSYDDGDTVDVKLLPRNGGGELSDATALTITLDQRANRPYPPSTWRIGGDAYPVAIMGETLHTWSHRDKSSQLADLNDETDGDIGPEAGVTYTAYYYDETNTLRRTRTGITGTTDTWTEEVSDTGLGRYNNSMRVVLKSVRSGLSSTYSHDFTFDRADYGYSYGEYYGGY